MVRGLLTKTLYENWLATLLFGVGLFFVTAVFTYIVPQAQAGLDQVIASMPFVRTIIQALLGSDFGEQITAPMMQSIVWVHPIILSIVWAHEIVFCSRLPAGEIDRGTIDVLLALPISRRGLYVCHSACWLLSGVVVLSLGVVGQQLGARLIPAEARPSTAAIAAIVSNLYFLYVAVGGVALLASSLSSRRGTAVALVFGLLLASFLLNFLAQIWPPAATLAPFGVLNYYQPARILRSGGWPVGDLCVLCSLGVATWMLGCESFARRDIVTV
jgi:putative exporter of polyketide antibiotics